MKGITPVHEFMAAVAATCLPHFFNIQRHRHLKRLDVGISEKKNGIPKSSGARMFPVITMAGCFFPQDDRAQLCFTGVSIVMRGTPKDG